MRRICYCLMLMMLSSSAALAGGEPYLGEIDTFPFTFCPQGWVQPAGQLLPISQNTALFSLLGTNYGGNGINTFGLPNVKQISTLLQGAPLIQCMAVQGIFPSRN